MNPQQNVDAGEFRRLNQLYAALAQVNQAITRTTDRQQLLEAVCRILVDTGGFRTVRLTQYSAGEHALLPVAQRSIDAAAGDNQPRYVIDDPLLGNSPSALAFRSGRPFISNELTDDPACAPWHTVFARFGYRSCAVFPVSTDNVVCGTLSVYAPQPGMFRDAEIGLLQNVANDISYALDNFARIEQRRGSEAALNRLAALVSSSDDGIVSATPDRLIASWNTGAEHIFGYSAEEIIGRPVAMLVPPERAGEEQGLFDRLLGGEHITGHESERLRKDGSRVPIAATFSPIYGPSARHPGAREIVGGSMIVRDISKRLAAEQAARRESEFSAALIDSTPGTLYLFNRDGHHLRWNRRLAQITGYRDEEIANMNPLQFFAPEEHALVRERITEAFTHGYAEVEAGLLTRDGRSIPFLFTGCRTLFDGMLCLIGVGIDISARKDAEARLAERTLRLQHMSRRLMDVQENERRQLARELHDSVGQELTALSLNLAAIGHSLDSHKDAALLGRLVDSQALLEQTSRHLRDVMVELRPPGLDELGLLAALKEHATQVCRRSGMQLAISGREPQPALKPAQAIALFRIAQEALNNAVKHAGAGLISLRLEDGPQHAELEIADSGCGFDPQQRPARGPSGMGMTTMRERADAIGARLQVHSQPGRGTRIVVEIPREAALQP